LVDYIALLIQIGTIAGSLIAVFTVVVKVTRHITKVEGTIKTQSERLDGRINELAARIEHMREDIKRQDNMITSLNNYWFNNISILLKIAQGEKNVKSDST
jgi:hypothetical protein